MKKEEKTIKEKFADIAKLLDENQIIAIKFDKFMNKTELEVLDENLVIFDNVDLLYKDLVYDEELFNISKDKSRVILLFRNGITRKVFTNKKSKFYGIKIYNFGCKTKSELKLQITNLFAEFIKFGKLNDEEIDKIINLSDSKDFYIEKMIKEIVLEKTKNLKFTNDEFIKLAYENIYNENILKHELTVFKARKKAYLIDILIALANNINPYNAIDMVAGNTAKYIAVLENDGLIDSELVGVSKFIYKIADPFFKEYLLRNFKTPNFKGYLLRQNKR